MILSDIVEIILGNTNQKNEKGGESIFVIKLANIPAVGFTNSADKIVCDISKISKYLLEEYDVLLSSIVQDNKIKVGIVGNITQRVFSNQQIYILRIKEKENKKDKAISLYMYLKSEKGQKELLKLVPDIKPKSKINRKSLEDLELVNYSETIDTKVICNFYKEQELIEEVNIKLSKINTYFNNNNKVEDIGLCKMCEKVNATHLRVDTWKPFEKGIPMCDECSKNIMF